VKGDKAVFNWSGGKDSALALHKVMESGSASIACLLTTVNKSFQRVSMHGVRTELLERQAECIGIPLMKVLLPEMPDMATYEAAMKESLVKLDSDGTRVCVFGDIFLEDLRKYREDKLAELGMKCLFPLWKIPTDELMREFIDLGFKAVTVCVDEKHLDKSFVGRVIDESFIRDLPVNVDPCGENGEFHTFVFDGPIFRWPVEFKMGEIVYRKYKRSDDGNKSGGNNSTNPSDPFDTGFWYRDLLPNH